MTDDGKQHPPDPLDDYQQPHCPECSTVLRTVGTGYECDTCDIVYLTTLGLLYPKG